jgi:tRNA G18 (ribose-2'-O)-methylase SpoU
MKTQLDGTQATRVLVLDNIRSTHNVGAIFRTADAIGIDKIYLGGITPGPLDRFGRKRKDVAKSALGAEETMEWEMKPSVIVCIEELKEAGFRIVVLEQTPTSKDYKHISGDGKIAVVVGNEVKGVSMKVLALADEIAEIPLQGNKESLNVSVATGVALYRFFDK